MWRYLLLLWGFLWLLSHCGKPSIKKEAILGTWEIVTATRNGKPTETLNGAFIQLEGDTLYTNLLGDEERGAFTYNRQRIISIRPTGDSLTLSVINLENGLLKLQTEIQNFVFDLDLQKQH